MPRNPAIRKFYNSLLWQECRAAYTSHVGGLCESCWKRGIATAGTEVHHKKKLTSENVNDPSIALNFDNLELLCDECHQRKHRKHANRRWDIDEYGQLILYDDDE